MQSAGGSAWLLGQVSGPFVAAMYVILSLTDMMLTSVAFVLGIPEGNPALAFLARHGLFLPVKVALTVVVAGLIVWLYPHRRARSAAWVGVVAMAAVVTYHVWGLRML